MAFVRAQFRQHNAFNINGLEILSIASDQKNKGLPFTGNPLFFLPKRVTTANCVAQKVRMDRRALYQPRVLFPLYLGHRAFDGNSIRLMLAQEGRQTALTHPRQFHRWVFPIEDPDHFR